MARFLDRYASFAELQRAERADRDYRIVENRRASPVAVIAPHGGAIEAGTSQLATAIAADRYSLYCFEGLKPEGNRTLHITSSRFDEPRALALVAASDYVVAIHGWSAPRPSVYMGGLDDMLKTRIAGALAAAGFKTESEGIMHLQAMSPKNICNRGRRGNGAQLEVSAGLRQTLVGRAASETTFMAFVGAVRHAIADVVGA